MALSEGTTKRAGGVRVARPLFHAEGGGSTPTSALQLHFDNCNSETARVLNRQWHSVLPKSNRVGYRKFYAAEYDGLLYAVALWGNPVARALPQREWLELRRFAIAPGSPKNTASRMLGWMARDIRKCFCDVTTLISYQDTCNHTGTIYRAAGWLEAKGYTHTAHGWEVPNRGGRSDQSVKPRMRWHRELRDTPATTRVEKPEPVKQPELFGDVE